MTFGTMVSPWDMTRLSGVVAGEDLPRGASAKIPLKDAAMILLTQDGFKLPNKEAHFQTIKMKNNELVPSCERTTFSWVADFVLAEDVHSETSRLDLVHSGLMSPLPILVLTLVKPVKKGELLLLWFSSELAATLGFPFLNFSHIRDGEYFCSKCRQKFRAPNPLKLHLATWCDTLQPRSVWSRLAGNLSLITWGLFTMSECSNLSGTTKSVMETTAAAGSVAEDEKESPDSTSCPNRTEPKHHSHFPSSRHVGQSVSCKSAFRPVVGKMQRNFHKVQGCVLGSENRDVSTSFGQNSFQEMLTTYPIHSWPGSRYLGVSDITASSLNLLTWPKLHSSAHTAVQSGHLLGNLLEPLASTSSVDPYADIETFMPSISRGKGSHLCLYCGKVYSRKYGLKIHIRTHTGYKPLKCRVCLRPFGDPSNLNKHVRLHAQGETPYRCEMCGKILVRKRDLERHLRSRHSAGEYTQINSSPRPNESRDSLVANAK